MSDLLAPATASALLAPATASALLAPATLARLERLVALARRAPAGPRRRAPHRAGRGVEPGARREYAPGDDVRLVDWPAYARLERLLVKVTEALPEPRLDLVLDGSASTACGAPSPHERQGLVAAALAACAVAREVHVVAWWAGPGEPRTSLRRPGELVRLLRFLAERRPAGPSRLAVTAARVAERARARGAAIVLGDGLDADDAVAAARRARQGGLDPLVVACAPEGEVGPADDPGAAAVLAALAADGVVEVDLVDAETGLVRRRPLGPATLAAAHEARAARLATLARACDAAGVPFERVSALDPFEALAASLLRGGA